MDSRWQLERRSLPGLRTSLRSETVSNALAGLRLGGGEHDVLAAADDRAASRLDDHPADSAFVGADGATVGRMTLLTDRTQVGQQHFARFAEIWEVDEVVTDDELEEEAAGAEVVRT